MREAMPAPDFEGGKKNQDIGSDEKTLKKINELENKWRKLRNKIENTHDDEEKRILKFDKEDLEKRIRQLHRYYDKIRNDKKLNDLRGKVGEKNVAKVIDLEKYKKEKIRMTKNEGKLLGEDFKDSLESFKKKKGYR